MNAEEVEDKARNQDELIHRSLTDCRLVGCAERRHRVRCVRRRERLKHRHPFTRPENPGHDVRDGFIVPGVRYPG